MKFHLPVTTAILLLLGSLLATAAEDQPAHAAVADGQRFRHGVICGPIVPERERCIRYRVPGRSGRRHQATQEEDEKQG